MKYVCIDDEISASPHHAPSPDWDTSGVVIRIGEVHLHLDTEAAQVLICEIQDALTGLEELQQTLN